VLNVKGCRNVGAVDRNSQAEESMLGPSNAPSNLLRLEDDRHGMVAIETWCDNIPPRHGCLGACCFQENREDGANPSRSRRCNRGRTSPSPLSRDAREGAASRSIREPEDLP